MVTFRTMFICGLLYVMVLSGCASISTSVVSFDDKQRNPTIGTVEVHTDRSNIKRPYKEIGLITVDDGESGEWGLSNENDLIKMALEKARKMGADGIIISLDSSMRTFGAGLAVNSAKTRIVRGVAFIYEK